MYNGARLVPLVVGSTLLLACNKPTPATADSATASTTSSASFDEKTAAAQIVAADSAYVRAIKAKNLDSLMIYYDPSAVSLGKTVTKGTSALRTSYGKTIQKPAPQIDFESGGVNFSNDHSMAWDYGTVTVTGEVKGKPVKTSGTYLNVWKNVGGKWMIVAEISSN